MFNNKKNKYKREYSCLINEDIAIFFYHIQCFRKEKKKQTL